MTASCFRWHRLQQLEDWADTVAGDGGCEADTSNSWDFKGSGAWHPLTLSWMPSGGVALSGVALPRRDRDDSYMSE